MVTLKIDKPIDLLKLKDLIFKCTEISRDKGRDVRLLDKKRRVNKIHSS